MVRVFRLPYARGYGLRLHRVGCANRPFYLIGAMPKKVLQGYKPKFRPDEVIGSYDPMPNERGEKILACDLNRFCYYIGKGAQPSQHLAKILGIAGFWPLPPKIFVNSWRKRADLPTRS